VYHDTTSDTTVIVMANGDIPSGDCSLSKTLADTNNAIPCMVPAVRIFVSISEQLGHPFPANPMQ
jgi:D-alanyl-D-alanine carboxypeptidase